jgi:hypothetical protein
MMPHLAADRPREWTGAGVFALVFLFSAPLQQPSPSSQGLPVKDHGLLEVRHVSVSIARPPSDVYEFAAKPENMPKWAAGLGKTFRPQGDGSWIAEGGPVGSATVRFVERNRLGVLDHDVAVPNGETVHNPIRVVPNGTGSEVIFTLFRRPGVSAAEFASDARAVEKDLTTLKRHLEKQTALPQQ